MLQWLERPSHYTLSGEVIALGHWASGVEPGGHTRAPANGRLQPAAGLGEMMDSLFSPSEFLVLDTELWN